MKKCRIVIIAVCYSFLFANMLFAAANTWTQKADFGGTARNSAVGFSIGSKGYIGTGYDGSDRKDFWEYDPAANTWTQKADFGGTARNSAVGFSIGSKGYIGTGVSFYGFSLSYSKDFWEYDPAANTWTEKFDFGETGRYGAVGFSIGRKGYIGTGYDGSNKKDFWEYDPLTDIWTQKADFGGTGRYGAVGFSIGSKGYIGTGTVHENSKYTYKKDFWEYDPAANTWTQKADFGGTAPGGTAVGFSIWSKGYIGTGYGIGTYKKDFWEYDPAANTWTQKADFGGTGRDAAVGFSIGGKGYIGMGNVWDKENSKYRYYKDFWEYESSPCTYALMPSANGVAATWAMGVVNITPSGSCSSWAAVSNDSWITVISGSSGTGYGTVSYSIAANTTGSVRTGTMTVGGSTITITQTGFNAALYFPHVDTSLPWQTEIAIINTSDQTVTGTLRAVSDDGQLVATKDVTLSAHGRRQITIANEFTNHTDIGYIIFDTNSAAVQGYTKFYQAGKYRAAIPAVKEVNTSDIYISHIDSSALWWTGVSLVNTTSARKDLVITFNNGLNVPYTLNANEHKAFTIGGLLNQPLQPDIRSAVITNANGVIGLELFGSNGSGNQLDGLLLSGNTDSTIYYPHVDSNGWWTGIVAYNPSSSGCTITITPYSPAGTPLSPKNLPIGGKEKYVGVVADLGLPADTAWLKIDSTCPLSGFELFGTTDGNQLAAYAGGSGYGATASVFAKIEKNGWTGIAFVNTEDSAASVTLTAYNDAGNAVATQVLTVGGHAKEVKLAEAFFSQSIADATYIAYSSDRNVVGFQLNGSSDGTMLDGLPSLGGTN